MSLASVLSGTPAGLTVPTGAESFLGQVATVASNIGAGDAGYVQWLEGNTSGATQRNFRRWVGLPTGAVSRKTVEDFGYDSAVAGNAGIQRYTQYKPVSDAAGANSQNAGEVCLNWGLLDTTRSGLITNASGTDIACTTIASTDQVWFFPQAFSLVGDPAVLAAPVVASITPGVEFVLVGAVPAGQTWRYLVVAGAPV